MNLKANRASRSDENSYLKVSERHVDLLNSVPEFRDLSTAQLILLLPHKTRKVVPPVGPFHEIRDHAHWKEDRMARAVCIGFLAKESQINAVIGMKFLETSFQVELS